MWTQKHYFSLLSLALLLFAPLFSPGAYAQNVELTEVEYNQILTALDEAETQLTEAKAQLQISNQALDEVTKELNAQKAESETQKLEVKTLDDQLIIVSEAYEQLATFWRQRRSGAISLNLGVYSETQFPIDPEIGVYAELSFSLR